MSEVIAATAGVVALVASAIVTAIRYAVEVLRK